MKSSKDGDNLDNILLHWKKEGNAFFLPSRLCTSMEDLDMRMRGMLVKKGVRGINFHIKGRVIIIRMMHWVR